ncbi:uncharacterized protein BO87DRAFT_376610 [Aspergillus neoniger CBS 115656]|uniref:Uncharacterized protein n=1 Tax=Aspergillus neoniger (strain CBS 115656) TaxID=1448310 RepID=A0A318YK86_ASPNB|nr:hypothetical protein BO87DRAFT_376610 [Aspergillus neoniger CBS 115656]PYH34237.1 hypothetical protein BO87DRAFT_376610 [Aspergillus neoniger CBS 115656]
MTERDQPLNQEHPQTELLAILPPPNLIKPKASILPMLQSDIFVPRREAICTQCLRNMDSEDIVDGRFLCRWLAFCV